MNINDFQLKERFKRNTIIESIRDEGQQRLFEKKVLVAGAGGLGSGVIANLVSAGIGSIGILDYDTVEMSNLNRQFIHTEKSIGKPKVDSVYEWIKKYSSQTNTQIFKINLTEDVNLDFFDNYNLVTDCFDSYKSKFILNKICVKKNLPLFRAGIENFSGQVLTIIPGQSSCLNCLFPEPDLNKIAAKGAVSPTVNVISSIQSMEAIKYLLGFNNLLLDTLLTYDGIKQDFRKIHLKRRIDCPVCG